MGLFERTHLPDQNSSVLCRGPSRGLHGDGFMVSITFLSGRLQGGPLATQEQMGPGEECCAELIHLYAYHKATAWGSSKGHIFRIKSPPSCAAARVAVCAATDSWNLFPFVAAGCSEGRLQLRSRWVLVKSAVPSLLSGMPNLGSTASKHFLRFRASRPGLFYDLSTGEFCPLRIPLALSASSGLGAAVSPADKP